MWATSPRCRWTKASPPMSTGSESTSSSRGTYDRGDWRRWHGHAAREFRHRPIFARFDRQGEAESLQHPHRHGGLAWTAPELLLDLHGRQVRPFTSGAVHADDPGYPQLPTQPGLDLRGRRQHGGYA